MVRPLDLVSYLQAKGWHEAQRLESGAFWIQERGNETHEILVPLDSGLRDFPTRISEILVTLEGTEDRSQFEILEDLTLQNADIIRPRLLGTHGDGSITIEQGMLIHEKARDLLLAAACAAIEPKSLYARRKPELAMAYLNRARFGLARRGSYIMTIISPVAPLIATEADLFGTNTITEPFERSTVRILARGLRAIANAVPEVARTGNIDQMRAAVDNGVSAQLCESIVGLHNSSGEQGVDFSFAWSATRRAPAEDINSVRIQPDAIPVIAETARIFRETAPVENIEVVGTVHRLQHISGQRGDVTILGIADGIQRTIHIFLDGTEHISALQAYESRRPVSCSGKLEREGRSWRLTQTRDFRVLSELF